MQDHSGALAAGVGAGKRPALAPEAERADGVLSGAVAEAGTATLRHEGAATLDVADQ